MASGDGGRLRLSKHEGAGNDFLVLVDPAGELSLDPQVVRALCDRHRGIGADGVIRVSRGNGTADLSMELRNADGSTAEMSGNGMRCLAQAAVDAGLVTTPVFTVDTAAGIRTVEYRAAGAGGGTGAAGDPGQAWASVDMGPVRLGDEPGGLLPAGAARGRLADVGNPHLVLQVPDPSVVDLATDGPAAAAEHPGGINVELIAPSPSADGDALDFRVWERGVGETLACGTGSVAAAEVARAWGLVGDRVIVHNPGGPLEVVLGAAPGETTRLGGPVRKVADVVVTLPLLVPA